MKHNTIELLTTKLSVLSNMELSLLDLKLGIMQIIIKREMAERRVKK